MNGGLLYKENSRQVGRNIVNPNIGAGVAETQRAINAGAVNNIEKMAEFGANVLDRQTRIAEEKFKLDLTSTIQNLVAENHKKNAANPQAFAEESKRQVDNLLSEIPGEQNKLFARGVFENISSGYYNRVLTTFQNNQDRDLKVKSMQFMMDSQSVIQNYYENKFDSLNTPDDDAQFAARQRAIRYYQDQKGVNGNYLFSENEKLRGYEALFKQSKINAGISHFDRLFENIDIDPQAFIDEVDSWEGRPDEIKAKYDLSHDEYNSILSRASAYKKRYDQFQKENEKSIQKAFIDRQKAEQIKISEKFKFDVNTLIDSLKIRIDQKGRYKITNSDYNNIESIYDVWHTIEEGYRANFIDEKEMYTLLGKIRKPYLEMIYEIKKKHSGSGNSAIKYAIDKLDDFVVGIDKKGDYVRDYSIINPDDKIFLVNSVLQSMIDEGIDPKDSSYETKRRIAKIVQGHEIAYQKDKFGGLKMIKHILMNHGNYKNLQIKSNKENQELEEK